MHLIPTKTVRRETGGFSNHYLVAFKIIYFTLPVNALSGTISGLEVQQLIRHSTGLGAEESASLAARLLSTYDVNGDGVLDIDELSTAVRANPQLLAAFQWVPA